MFIFPFLFHFFVIISSDNLTNTGVCITTQLIRIQTVSYEEYKLILVFFRSLVNRQTFGVTAKCKLKQRLSSELGLHSVETSLWAHAPL